jgi:hypothetical protein
MGRKSVTVPQPAGAVRHEPGPDYQAHLLKAGSLRRRPAVYPLMLATPVSSSISQDRYVNTLPIAMP